MTLITRLSTAFTDTTLPILRRDPILVDGSMFLLDGKNPYVYSGVGADNLLAPTEPLYSLADAPFADGTNPGQGYWSLTTTPIDLSTVTRSLSHDPATGRFGFPAQPEGTNRFGRFIESEATGTYIFNAFDSYCISAWFYIGNTGGEWLYVQGAGNDNTRIALSAEVSLNLPDDGDANNGPSWRRPSRVGYPISPGVTATTRNDNRPHDYGQQPVVTTPGIYRVGFAWYRKSNGAYSFTNSGDWHQQAIFQEALQGEFATPSHVTTGLDLGQSTAGGARDPYWVAALGGRGGASNGLWGTDTALCRFYVENLTTSGRTPEQVWAADWERGNGRFS